jgi:putative aldouronate transport system permease protein
MTDANKEVLQMVMRRIVLDGQMQVMSTVLPEDQNKVNTETIKAATIMVTTIPIIIIYPFLQKYFVKGMLLGSVKG